MNSPEPRIASSPGPSTRDRKLTVQRLSAVMETSATIDVEWWASTEPPTKIIKSEVPSAKGPPMETLPETRFAIAPSQVVPTELSKLYVPEEIWALADISISKGPVVTAPPWKRTGLWKVTFPPVLEGGLKPLAMRIGKAPAPPVPWTSTLPEPSAHATPLTPNRTAASDVDEDVP